MSEASFEKLSRLFNEGNFTQLLRFENGLYFLKLRAMSRNDILTKLCKFCDIAVPERDFFRTIFDKNIPIAKLDKFVCQVHTTKLADYDTTEDELYRPVIQDAHSRLGRTIPE